MKIESPTYSPNSIRNNQVRRQKNASEFVLDKNVIVEKTGDNNNAAVHTTKSALVNLSKESAAIEKSIPRSLADVISPEEQAMLSQLFGDSKNGWGVPAYRTQSLTHKESVLGNNLDLKS
jgi:hypothetical protein